MNKRVFQPDPRKHRNIPFIPFPRRILWQGGLALLLFLALPVLGAYSVQSAEGRGGGYVSVAASGAAGTTAISGGSAEPVGGAFPADSVYGRIESLFEHGGVVMWVLLATSVFGATFAMERCFALRRAAHIPAELTDMLREKLLEGGTLAATSYLEPRREGLARVLHGVLSRPGATRQEMERVLEDELSRALWDERRYIRPVGIVAQVAPLLGLLGTVIGLIGAFQQAAAHGMDDPTLFAGGIYQALYTTAFGLTISIPFLIAYQYLRSKADAILREIEVVSQRFVFALSRDMSLPALQRASATAFSFAAHPAPTQASPAPTSCAPSTTPRETDAPASSSEVSISQDASQTASTRPMHPEAPSTVPPPSVQEGAGTLSPLTRAGAEPGATPSPDDPTRALLEGDPDSDELFPEMR